MCDVVGVLYGQALMLDPRRPTAAQRKGFITCKGPSYIVFKSVTTVIHCYRYAVDRAAWLWTLLRCGQSGRTYNIREDESLFIFKLALCGTGVPVRTLQNARLSQVEQHHVPNPRRCTAKLLQAPPQALIEELRRIASCQIRMSTKRKAPQ